MIETLIYDRLRTHTALIALVGSRIFPDKPTVNTAMPFAVYSLTDADDFTTLEGKRTGGRSTLQIEAWGVNQSNTLAVLASCKLALNNWAEGRVTGAFFVTQGTLEAEEGYQGIAIFNVWDREEPTIPTNAILTGNDEPIITDTGELLIFG